MFDRQGLLWRLKGRLFAITLMAVICLLWGLQVWRNHERAVAEAETLAASLARSLEYQVRGSMRGVAALLDEMADTIDPARWPDLIHQERFRSRLSSLPEVRNLSVTDDKGRIVDASMARAGESPHGEDVDVGDRDYFQELLEGLPERKIHLGRPIQSRTTGKPAFAVIRAVLDKDGRLKGTVIAGVDPAVFRDQIASVSIEPEGGAALIRADGLFLARVPNHEAYFGRSVASSPLFTVHLAKAPVGVAHFISVADGNDKIVAFRSIEPYPLVVTVGVTMRTALAHWSRQSLAEAVALAILAAALFSVAALYDKRADANRVLVEKLEAGRKELERQVEERTANLAASNAQLERFAYIASHDLKEPLRSVACFMQLLEKRYGPQLDKEAREYIDFAVAASKRSSQQIDDLLAFSRAGRFEGPAEPCDAEALARAAVEDMAKEIEESRAKLEIAPLPAVECRPAQLQSLFQNLIANAIKYKSEERAPEIRIEAEPGGDGLVRFAVNDNGIGIESKYHERVFGVFQRLHPYGRYPGTGIGLALCRKIVERHGGKIWLDSAPGQGTTVHFTLKAAA